MFVTSHSNQNKNWMKSLWPKAFLVFFMVLTLISPVSLAQSRSSGSALRFNGVDQLVDLDQFHGFDTATFTLEAWFNWTGSGTPIPESGAGMAGGIPFMTIDGSLDSDIDANLFFGIQASTGKLMAAFKEEPSIPGATAQEHVILGGMPVTAGVWHHAAVTYDGQTWKIFLDGSLNASQTFATPVLPQLIDSQHAYLAATLSSYGAGRGFFKGDLDEVRIWESARSQSEIRAWINLEKVSDLNLSGQWSMNEGTGLEVYDSSGKGIKGTAVNAPVWISGAPFSIPIASTRSSSITSGTSTTLNAIPTAPVLISPSDNASGVSTSPILTVSASDPDLNDLSVTFYGRAAVGTPVSDFTLAVLPDTQKYSINGLGIFDIQTQWIIDQRSVNNIAFVTHLGDMVDDWNVPFEWDVANAAMSKLEPYGIPYGITPGNCDEDHYGIPPETTFFNTYFPASRFAGRSYYGGAYNGDNANSYQLFSAGGMDFIVIHLKYNLSRSVDESQAVLAWADTLMKTYNQRRAIVVTHYLINTSNNFSTDGSQIYSALKGNPNLFLMLGGHLDTEGQRQDLGSDGHIIYSLRSDYQNRANGGNGWMRLLRFSPAMNKIFVTTYSPYLHQYETDADSQFSLDYEMNETGFQTIGTVNVPSGSIASMEWPGLLSGTEYEWYVTVNDGTETTTGPSWNFATGNGSTAPVVTTQPISQIVNESELAAFSSAASGTPTPTVQWQVSTDGINWNTINGATSNTYSFTAQLGDNGKQFRAVFTNSAGSIASNQALLNVPPISNTAPGSPMLNSPVNGSTDASTLPILNVSVSDPESNNLAVTFYGRSTVGTMGQDFTLVALPDTQYYSVNGLGIFDIQTQWIVDQRLADNIAFVTHLGGMVDDWNVPSQWDVANAAMSKLEPSGIPYGIGVGNTDEDHYGVPPDTTFFNTYFPSSRFGGRTYYGGAYNGDNSNSYQLFSASGMDFIMIHLKYNLSYTAEEAQAILAWADNLLKTNSDRRAIVVTHYLLNTSNGFSADGSQIYSALKGNPNLFLMLGAHLDTEGQRQDLGSDGHVIYSLRSDYHNRANGGNGWLRLLRFSPAANKIYVSTYSPYLNQYETDTDSQFSLDYDMNETGFQTIGTVNVPSGSIATMEWPGLLSGTEYEWYVTVSDGAETTTGPSWNFTTGSGSIAPVVTIQPISKTVNAGQAVTFDAAASGTPAPAVQWQVSTDGSNWNNIAGALSTTYTFTSQSADNEKRFRAVFTNSAGSTTSDIATLTVNTAPLITMQPVDQTVSELQVATFSTSSNGIPTPTVQWQVSTNGITWNDLAGAATNIYSFSAQASDSGKQFRAVFTNPAGVATSNAATLTVNTAPVVVTHPTDRVVNAGDTVTLNATANGYPTPTVRWQVSTDGNIWNNIDGATSSIYALTTQAADNGKQFRAVFTNDSGSATSNIAILIVNFVPIVTAPPIDQTVNAGNTVTFTSTAGGNPIPLVRWQVSTDGSTWNDIVDANSTTYTFTSQSVDNGKQFRAVFSNSAGSVTSNSAMLTVNYISTITGQPVSQTVIAGQITNFTAAASGNPAPSVRWQVSANNGSTWSDIAGATSTTYSFTTQPVDNGRQFHAVFTNLIGSTTTNAATLTVNTAPAITIQPSNLTVNENQSAAFSAQAGGFPAPTVQWQVSADNGATWNNIVGATSITYSFTALSTDNNRRYRAVFTNQVASVATNPALLNVINDLIFKDGFNSCNASAWTGGTVNSARLAFKTTSGRNSTCGMAVSIVSSAAAYVVDPLPNAETHFRTRFYFNPYTVRMGTNITNTIYGAYNTFGQAAAVVQIRYTGSSIQVRSGLLSDANTWSYTLWVTISRAWHSVELDWRASTTTVANNGGLTFWVDGVQKASLTGINNDQHKIDKAAIGAVTGLNSTMYGTYFFEDYESRRQSYIGQ